MQTALIRNLPDGRTKLVLVKEIKNDVQIKTHFLEKWDMRLINPLKNRHELSREQTALLMDVLRTPQGMKLLNKLKNERSNSIINEFLGDIKNQVKPNSNLQTFFEGMIQQPLIGNNQTKNVSIGITKIDLWNACLKEELIIKY